MRRLVVEGDGRHRLDQLLAAAAEGMSRTALQRALAEGRIRSPGRQVKASDRPLGSLEIEWEPEVVRPSPLEPVAVQLRILHEDEALIVIDKPPGMVVHAGAGVTGPTLVQALLAHCAGSLSGIGGVERPGIVHRLDRETSGVLVAAKTDSAHRKLARAFHDRTVRKLYGVLVAGMPGTDSGEWSGSIARHPRRRHRMAVVEEGGRAALTLWHVHRKLGPAHTWLLCEIKTGRTHQIRVHCEAARLPVVGDATYGWKPGPGEAELAPRVMLHARSLEFTHPLTRRKLRIEAPWPDDLLAAADALARLGGACKPNRNGRR